MQTQHTVQVSKSEEAKRNGDVWNTTLTINWPDTDAPQWLIDIARKSIVISWQGQMRSKMNAKEKPLKKVEKAYEVNAEDYKPKERLSQRDKTLQAAQSLSKEDLEALLAEKE